MKKKIIYIIGGILAISGIAFLIVKNCEKRFYFEKKYYESSGIKEINIDAFYDLINKKESFGVFIYESMCITSANFEVILNEFLKENKLNIYKISFSNLKDTEIGKVIKYYPSFIIYHKGELVDYLEANKDEDIKYYTKKDSFKKWFTKYIKLK